MTTTPRPATEASRPEAVAPILTDVATPRLGGLSRLLAPAEVADPGRLRLGGLCPIFGQS